MCLCSLAGVRPHGHRIPNSASYHFSKVHFWNIYINILKKTNNCTVCKTAEQLIQLYVFVFWVGQIRKVLNNLTLFSILSYGNFAVYLSWMRCVCVCVCYVGVCLFLSVWTHVTDVMGCVANWSNSVTGQERQITACNYTEDTVTSLLAWLSVSLLSSHIQSLFLFKKILPIYSPQMSYEQ